MKPYKLILLLVFIFTVEKSLAQFVADPVNPNNIYNTNMGKIGLGIIPLPDVIVNTTYVPSRLSPFLQIHGLSGKTGGIERLLLPVVKITASNSTNSIGFGLDDSGYPNYFKYAYVKTEGRYSIISTDLEVTGTSFLRNKVVIAPAPANIGTYPFTAPELATPGNYMLYVKGGILTEKIKVALTTDAVNWSDFVFAKDYKLRPLSEVESYVKQHHHLPEIPSSEEVYKDGLDLAQMDAKLLMKIEELTLYMIELKKENEKLKEQMEALKNKIK